MMVSPKRVGDAADAAEERNRGCTSDAGCFPTITPLLKEACRMSIPVGPLLILLLPLLLLLWLLLWLLLSLSLRFVPAAALTGSVLEAVCLKRLPTNEVDGTLHRRDTNGADMMFLVQ